LLTILAPASVFANMIFPNEMMHESVWMDRLVYDEAEEHYQLYLNKNLTVQITSCHATTDAGNQQVTGTRPSPLSDEIAKARENINTTLSRMKDRTAPDTAHVSKLEEENKTMRKLIEDLTKQVKALELRVGKLEGSPTTKSTPVVTKKEEKADDDDDDDDDDDFDMFGDEDEEDEAAKKRKEELVQKYHEKKSKKPALIAKSSITLDVKPWDDETDMAEMERLVRTIEMDGLVWGQSKLVPLAFGIKKLQIICVVEDEKVGSEDLSEAIEKFEDHVQSVDIAAFNKI